MYRTPAAESDPGQARNTSYGSQVRNTLYQPPSTRICYFYKDGDVNTQPVRLTVNPKHFGNLDRLAVELQKKVRGMPNGVRSIYTPGGNDRITKLNQLQNDGRYVLSTHRNKAHGVDIARVHNRRPWRGGRPPTARKQYAGFLSDSQVEVESFEQPRPRRQAWNEPASRKGLYNVQPPKKIEVIRNGDPGQKHVVLLNRRTVQTFEQVLEDLGQMFQMPAKKMFTLQGRAIKSLSAIFNGPDMYVISRGERFIPMGALTDPGFLPTSGREARRKPAYTGDRVASKIKTKRDKLLRTKGKWKVWVTTNEIPSAGTHAQVTLTAYGQKGNSGPIPLGYADGETFQAGNIDEFEVSVGNIGEIFKIRMAQDNTANEPGWLLDEVRMKDVHTEEQLVFKSKRWLSRDEDDCEICREMPAVREREQTLPIQQYEVRVFTGEVWNGGTDASVYITIYGEKGDTGVRQLFKSNMSDKFAKGNEDMFVLEAVSLGNLKRVIMGHDGTGPGQGWYLDKVVIKEMPRGMTWVFPCDKWLDEDEEDGKIVRELKAEDEYATDVLEKAMWEYEKWKYSEHTQILMYSRNTQLPLRIKQDGSIDANGDYVDTFGVFNVLGKKPMVRTFQCASNPKFHLAIDNAKVMGLGKGGAYCEFKIRVQEDRSVMFESNKYPLQFLNIQPTGKPGDPRSGELNEPHKQFFVYPKGILRDGGVLMLCTSIKQTLNIDHDNTLYGTGKRNRLAHFRVHKVKGEDRVRMFESVTFPGQYIRVQGGTCDVQGAGGKDKSCQFKIKRVKDKGYISLESVGSPGIMLGMMKDGKVRPTVDTGDKNTRFYPEVIQWGKPRGAKNVFATEVQSESPVPVETKPKKIKKPRKTPIPVHDPPPATPVKEKSQYEDGDWKLLIATDESAYTARVAMVVYGDKGNSGEIILGEAAQDGLFQSGNQDQFKINLARVGKVYKIRLELHPTTEDVQPSWKVKEVKMQDANTKETLKFKFNRLFSRQSGDGTLMCELPAIRPAQDVPPVLKYRVAVETGDEPGGDTDANVYLTIFGEQGDTGKRRLVHYDQRRKFQQGQVDSFELEAVFLGKLETCVLSHDGTGAGEGWKCETVVIKESASSSHKFHFPCHKWLDVNVGDGKIERVLKQRDEEPPKVRTPTPTPRAQTPVREKTEEIQEQVQEEEKQTFNDGDYTIWTTTGKDDTMATKNKVYLVAYGNKNKSEQLELQGLLTSEPDKQLFATSQTDEFKVNLGSDLGELYKVRIGHSDEDRQSGWFVEKMKMKNLCTDEMLSFKVNRWMSRLQEDNDVWREFPVISPGKQPLPVLPYVVEVFTGTEPGADTEANVYLQLIGTRGDSGKRVLFNSISDLKFQPGQRDIFRIEAVTLEEVTQVIIGHDGKGKGAGWYCERVVVKEGPDPDAQAYYFPCNRWLDEGLDDGQIERVLERGEAPKESQGIYSLWVKTASDSNPPNGSLATITVYGEKGRSKEMELSQDGNDVFQPGSTDNFEIAVGDIGAIYKIRVARKFDDTWEGWHLDEVKMQDKDTETVHVFTFDRWLHLYQGDHDIAREMPVTMEGQDTLKMQTYDVLVFTGDHWAAETDANVYVTLCGSRGDSGKRYLHHSTNNDVKFRKNQMDTFVLEAVTLDDLERVVVGHDGIGHGAGFYLDKVIIREREGEKCGKDLIFPCNQWLDDNEGDGKTERHLKLADIKDKDWSPAVAAEGVKTQGEWDVTVTTSDVTNAGTHATVCITVYGEKTSAGPLPLDASDPDQFDKGKESTFKISVGDIGDVYKVRIEHDNSQSFPAWHLQQVLMRDTTTGEELCWYVNRWLAEDEDTGALCRELPAVRPSAPPLPVLRYYIATYTANIRNAETTADVKVTLYGSHGDTGSRCLAESRTRQTKFMKGQIDVFTIEAVNLGSLHKLVVEHNGTDKDSAWFLEKVIVKESECALTEHVFPCSDWVEPGAGAEPAHKQLYSTGVQIATALPSEEQSIMRREGTPASSGDWVVWTHTHQHTEDPTETSVSIALVGTEMTSSLLPLKYQGEDDGEVITKRFLPGATDVFRVSAGEVGELMKIRVVVDPIGKNPNWYLNKIKMKDIHTKQEFHFPYDAWIRKAEGVAEDLTFELPTVRPDIAPLSPKMYQVAVTTGDELCSETSADVYCILIGQYGDSGKRFLLKTNNHESQNFRRSQTDVFEIGAVDLGALRMVIVGHDKKGRGKGWYCDRVTVIDSPDATTQTVFPCSQWLDTGIGDRKLERILLPLASGVPVPTDDEDSANKPVSQGAYKAFVESAGASNSTANTANSNNNHNNSNGNGGNSDGNHGENNSDHDNNHGNHKHNTKASQSNMEQHCCNSNSDHVDSSTSQQDFCDEFSSEFYEDFYDDFSPSGDHNFTHIDLDVPLDKQSVNSFCDNPVTHQSQHATSHVIYAHYDVNTNNNANGGVDTDGQTDELELTPSVVTIMVYGDKETAGPIELNNGDGDMFCPGKLDEFDLHVGDVGEIYKIRVANALNKPWCIRQLTLLDVHTKHKLLFDFSKYIGQSEGDIRKELPAVRPNQPIPAILQYHVTIETQDKALPSDAQHPDVFIRLFGERGDSGSRHLNKMDPDGASAITQPRNTHTFIVEAVDLQRVTKVLVTKGRGLPLPIKQIRVKKAEFTAEEWLFNYESAIEDDESRVTQQVVIETTGTQPSQSAVSLDKCPDLPKSAGIWHVWTMTGSDSFDGTSSGVNVTMCGSKGESQPTRLKPFESEETPFQKGATDHFVLQVKEDIGDVEKIRVEFTEPRENPNWFLHNIRFEDEDTADEFCIDVNDWLRVNNEDDGVREYPVVWPGIVPKQIYKYIVKTFTGDRNNAGTNANVYLTLYGNHGNSGKRALKCARHTVNKFEQGQMDKFVIEAGNLGDLEKVTIGHDGDGIGSGWYLHKVVVKSKEKGKKHKGDKKQEEKKTKDNEKKDDEKDDDSDDEDDEKGEKRDMNKCVFVCNRWLDVGEDDKATERVLMRVEKENSTVQGEPWKIQVTTGKEDNASTSERIALVIYGDNGKSKRLYLGEEGQYKGEGEIDTFEELVTPDLGPVYKVRVGYGVMKEDVITWKLDMLLLENLKTGERYEFVYGDWVTLDGEHDGWVEIPVLKHSTNDMLKLHTYVVRVQTSDVDNAGTDADVYVKLCGQRGDTGKRHLKQSLKDKSNKFERGAVEKFEIDAVDLGDIETVVVGHSAEGFGAGWHLHSVLVKDTSVDDANKFYFHCDKWLDLSEDDGKIERELVATEPPQTPQPTGAAWTVTIRNGSEKDDKEDDDKNDDDNPTGVAGDVTMVIYGDGGKSGPLALPSANELRFKPTQTEQYQIAVEEELGNVYKIRLQMTSEKKIRWPVEYVLLQKEGSDKPLRFELNGEIVLNNKHDGCREIPVCAASETDDGAFEPTLQVHKYEVSVYTGDKSNAGTDANVYVQISGRRGDTGARQLLKSHNDKMFEQDQTDTFEIEAVDLQELESVRVGHDGKGFGAGWYLNKIIIQESIMTKQAYIFQCDRWLDEGEDDEQIERVLQLTKIKEIEQPDLWRVWITTATPEADDPNSKQMETDGRLVLAVYGDKCGTADYALEMTTDDAYKPACTDQCDIPLCEDIGVPYKIRLGYMGGTSASQTYAPQTVKLKELSSGNEYVFDNTSDQWLIVNDECDGWLEIPLTPQGATKPLPVLKYHVEVYTGDKLGAGTNSNVYLCIEGERGDTGRRPLKHSRTYGMDKFEQDHMDLFELEAVQLLKPHKLIIGHDRSGSGWYLEKVIIKEARNAKKEFVFPCQQWLDKDEGDKLTERELNVLDLEGEPWSLKTLTSIEKASGVPGPAVLIIYGDKGHSKPIQFGDDLGFHFEDGQSQDFAINVCFEEGLASKDVGEVYKVRVGLDPLVESPGELYWNLDTIILKDLVSSKECVFDLNGRIDLTNEKDSWTEIPVSTDNKLPVRQYYVEVHTADEGGAGTDANVFLQVIGKRGDTGRRKLLVSQTEGNKFEKGEMDIFTIQAVDLDEVTSLVVGHDGKGLGSGWKLEKVIIKDDANSDKAYLFECNRWLDEGEDDGLLERELSLTRILDDEPAQDPPTEGDWKVLITSGDEESRGATNAQVHWQVFGDKGDSGPMPLGAPGEGLFQAGNTDQFDIFLQPTDIGKMRKIRIWHDNTDDNPGWFIQKICMEELVKGTKLEMPVNRWLHQRKEDGDVTREIPVIWPGEDPLPVTVYEVAVETGKQWGGGTDAHPHVTLYGEKGDSGRRVLCKNNEGGDMFEAGKTDTFNIEAVDLGSLKSVEIGHDREGSGAGWFLERVLIREGHQADVKLIFPCNNWLDKDEGDKLTERMLQLDGTEPIEGNTDTKDSKDDDKDKSDKNDDKSDKNDAGGDDKKD